MIYRGVNLAKIGYVGGALQSYKIASKGKPFHTHKKGRVEIRVEL